MFKNREVAGYYEKEIFHMYTYFDFIDAKYYQRNG